MSVKLRRSEKREQIRTAAEKLKHCLIFSPELFYVTIIKVLSSLLILPIIRFDYTTRTLCKHDVIKVCSVEYLTTEIELELVLPTFKSWIVHKIIEP